MRRLARFGLVAMLALLALPAGPSPAAVAAEQFRVVGVNRPDVLNIRSGPSARHDIVGTIPPGAGGIAGLGQCQGGWCLIRFGSIEGWVNARYIAPDRNGAPLESAGVDASEAGGGQVQRPAGRSVLADGTLERRHSDGSAVRLTPDGRDVLVATDGTVRSPAYIQVQTTNLPPLPPEYATWGNRVGDGLIGILRNILNEREMTAYLQTETGKSYYELVQWRLRSITFLTQPGS
jgi:uncharacterized protein YraI